MTEISTKFNFEASHKLVSSYNKDCKENLHGHSYKLIVTLIKEDIDNDGMVIDFKKFKEMIKPKVDELDHSLILFEEDPLVEKVKPFQKKLVLLGMNPTAEVIANNIYADLYWKLDQFYKDPKEGFKLKVELFETEDNWVTVYLK